MTDPGPVIPIEDPRLLTIVLLSGGLDSTVAAAVAVQRHGADRVGAISFDYGQRHRYAEIRSAVEVARALGIDDHEILEVPLPGETIRSALTDQSIPVPDGHYEDASMRQTVVPGRNLVLMSLAAMHAWNVGARSLTVAMHAGDHAIYPDCRPEFASWMQRVLSTAHYTNLRLTTPFIGMTKADIARKGHELGAPMHLSWSCYKGGRFHCGTCGTCTERIEAFVEAGVPDPTRYDQRAARKQQA